MATVTCTGTGCGTELGPADLLCPDCGSPRPRSSMLASSRAEGSRGGDPGQHDGPAPPGPTPTNVPPESAAGPCEHRDSPPGALICPACGVPIAAARSPVRSPRFRLVMPWGEHVLDSAETEVGRDVGPFASALKGHMTVSRRHASLLVTSSGRLHLIDHGSANGTFRNENRIEPNVPVELRSGDTVGFSTRLSFTVLQIGGEP